MKSVKIEYSGVKLEIPDFLYSLWPHSMPVSQWPTYCGSGDGIGDWLVPDSIHGVRVCPACFIHDIDWAISKREYRCFMVANNRFRRNLLAIVSPQLSGGDYLDAYAKINLYWAVVSSPIGWANFAPESTNPFQNSIVRDRLNRLARANMGIA